MISSNIFRANSSNESVTNIESCSLLDLRSRTSLIMGFGMIANVIAVFVLGNVKNRPMTNIHFMLLLMAANDLMASSGINLNAFILTLSCEQFSENLACDVIGWLTMSSFCWSIHIVTVMNIERYFMICRHMFHRKHFTRSVIVILCLIGVLLTFFVLLLPLVGIGAPYKYYKENKICTFDLSIYKGHTTHNVLVAYCACQGMGWCFIIIVCNILINKQLRKPFPIEMSTTNNNGPSKKAIYATLTKVIAGVNCCMSLPLYVSLFFKVWVLSVDD